MRPLYRIVAAGVVLAGTGVAYLLLSQPSEKASESAQTEAGAPVESQSGGSTVLTAVTGGGSSDLSGTWRTIGGTTSLKCPGVDTKPTMAPDKEWKLERGSDAPLVLTDEGCTVRFDVRAGEAIARAGQSCKRPSDKAETTLDYSMFSIKSGDGRSARVELRATTLIQAPNGSLTCTMEATYQATRVSG